MTEQQIDLPEGWKWKKLEDLALVSAGNPAPQNENDFDEKGIPFVRVRDLGAIGNSKYLVDVKDSLSIEGSKGLKRFEKGSLLLTKSGASTLLNQRALLKEDCCVVSHIAVAKPSKDVSSEWLYYWFKTVDFAHYAHGANMPSMPLSKIKKINIPFVDSIKQKQIVAKIEELFSHIDAGIESLKTAQEKLKQYRQSVLKAAVTGELTKEWREQNASRIEPANQLLKRIQTERRHRWEQQKLAEFQAKGKPPKNDKWKEKYLDLELPTIQDVPELPSSWSYQRLDVLSDITGGLTVDSKRKSDDTTELPYLRVANVQRGYLNLEKMKTIKVPNPKLESLLLQSGDILFTEGGDRDKLGRGWVWNSEIEHCTFQNHIFRARLITNELVPEFISYFGNTFGQEYFIKQGKQTTNLASINKTKLSAFPVPLCSLDEQKEIVQIVEEKLSSADRLMNEIETKLTQAQQQKQTILATAFSGSLV